MNKHKIFVNLPVKDLKRTMDFFSKLGFGFNAQFTNENAACLVIGDDIYAMLLVEKFFKTFIKKELVDATKATEALIALSAGSRSEVDDLAERALKAGGTEPRPAQEYPWMYSRSFQDLDGHLWELVYMDMTKVPRK